MTHPSPEAADPQKSLAPEVPTRSEKPTTKSLVKSPVKPHATPTAEQIARWAIPDSEQLQLLACNDGFSDSLVQCLAVTPDGKHLAVGGSKLTLWNSNESQPTIDLIAELKKDEVKRPILCAGISPDGKLLAAGDQGGKLRIWNLADHRERLVIQAHPARLTELAFSPDSRSLATTSYSGEIRVWQSADGKELKRFQVDEQQVAQCVFLSDNRLATAGREVGIWDVESGKKESVLTTGRILGPAIGLSGDRGVLAFNNADSQIQFWDVQKGTKAWALKGTSAQLIEFSQDGNWIATLSGDSRINIWNVASKSIVQVIDADGGRTAGIKWLPEGNVLVVASQLGRVRFWGTPEAASSLSIEPLPQPVLGLKTVDERSSYSSARFKQIIDVRSFPRLPDAVTLWGDGGFTTYNAPVSQNDAELFYRYILGKAGWTEMPTTDPSQAGLHFRKDDCQLSISMIPATAPTPDRSADLQISLQFGGNYDVRWLPKISAIESKSDWSSFSSTSYRTKATMTDVEVALLKQFHGAGWTAYTRLAASSTERPESRSISMLQGGSVMTVSIGPPADSVDELVVQTSVNISNKSLPIPADSGWIEFDSSTDLRMVANTGMDLNQTVEFYDKQMASEGWLARESGRHIEDEKGWLPYIRGQQDVLIRLMALPDAKTRIIVGEAEDHSWQLRKRPKSEEKAEPVGIEAADFQLPKDAIAVNFDVDQKQIQYEVKDAKPQIVSEQFVKQMETHQWKREGAGVISDEYVFITFSKDKKEIQLRARAESKKATAQISGDGLLWTRPLPAPPVRISYETWLKRNGKLATLHALDEFAEEMHKISVASNKSN